MQLFRNALFLLGPLLNVVTHMLLVDARHLEGSKWRRFGDERITVLLSRCRDDPDLCDNYSPALTSDKKCTDIPTKVYRNSDLSEYQDVQLFWQS